MLETEEVDDDYFTPVASTSLANIFDKTTKSEGAQNESLTLKYTPPKSQTITDTKPLPKATECVFACVLFAYQWMNDGYQSKGKIGFAVMRSIKDNAHSIVLYDSKKQSLSTTKITRDLVITVKGDSYISFYDSHRRYWNVYSTQGEILKIIDLLKTLEANIKNINSANNVPPESQAEKYSIEHNLNEQPNIVEANENEKDSDTDSMCNKKTKASILNRMATMGQSVLPRVTELSHKKSDSSDINDTDDENESSTGPYIPSKNYSKKFSHESLTAAAAVNSYDKQLVPIQNKSADHKLGTDTDLKLFITEQRINNTEVRMNINRLSDKLDKILEKSSNIINTDNNSTFQMDIFQKLIIEYESKIKTYEQLVKPKVLVPEVLPTDASIQDEKDSIIADLRNQITEYIEQVEKKSAENKLLLKEIENLNKNITEKDEDIEIEKKKLDIVADVIKTIMNDTFVKIIEKFKSGQNYSSDFIKSTIAEVIKNSTINYLSEQKK